MAFDPVSLLLEVGNKVIDRVWPNPIEAAQAKLELVKMQQSGDLAVIAGQMEINKAEATNPSVFVSGARPFVMWVCGTGFALQYLVYPILTWYLSMTGQSITLPVLDTGTLMTLLGGMLGLGGLRTVEKLNGVARM